MATFDLAAELRLYRYGPLKKMREAANELDRLRPLVVDLRKENERLRNLLLEAARRSQTERIV